MTSYSISDPDRPWIVLYSNANLDSVAEALAAQQEIDPASIYATADGKSRSLTAGERIELFQRVLELRPEHSAVTAALAAARGTASS